MTDCSQWQPIHHGEERDQERDTWVDHHWAEIGPADDDEWTWDIRTLTEAGDDTYSVTSGLVSTEQDAKDAVAAWERGASS